MSGCQKGTRVQGLRAFAALSQDMSSVPRPTFGGLKPLWTPVLRDLIPCLASLGVCVHRQAGMWVCTQTHTSIYTRTHKPTNPSTTNAHKHTYTHISTHAPTNPSTTNTHKHTHPYTYIHMHPQTSPPRIHIHVHTCVYTHTCTYKPLHHE